VRAAVARRILCLGTTCSSLSGQPNALTRGTGEKRRLVFAEWGAVWVPEPVRPLLGREKCLASAGAQNRTACTSHYAD
jgi:hypothetical protein